MALSSTARNRRTKLSTLELTIVWALAGAGSLVVLLIAFDWESGPSQLALLITTVCAMGLVVARNAIVRNDVLRLSSTIPLAWFMFLFPNSLMLVDHFRVTYIYYFKVLNHTLPIYADDATYALGIVALGSVCYAAGAIWAEKGPGHAEADVASGWFDDKQFRHETAVPLALGFLTLYVLMLLALAGGLPQMLNLITDPVARDGLQSTSLTAILVCLFFGFLITVALRFANHLGRGIAAFQPSSLLLFTIAAAMALPLASRGYVFSVVLYPILIFHYLKRRVSVGTVVLSSLTLPVIATLLRLLRIGAASVDGFSFTDSVGAFFSESNMVSMLSAACGALQRGQIGYANGLDFILFFTWFVPRALWPGKYLPLDYRLTLQLGISDNGRAYGSPVTIFGGLFLNLTLAGMAIMMFWIGTAVVRQDRSLRLSQPRSLLWRVILFAFLVDLTRVGDVSRELTVLFIQWMMFSLIAAALNLPQVENRLSEEPPDQDGLPAEDLAGSSL